MTSRTVRTVTTPRKRTKQQEVPDNTPAGDLTFVAETPKNTPRVTGKGLLLTPNLERARDEAPGEWRRIVAYDKKSTATGVADGLRKGRRGIPPGKWTIQTSKLDDGRYGVFARYEGEQDSE